MQNRDIVFSDVGRFLGVLSGAIVEHFRSNERISEFSRSCKKPVNQESFIFWSFEMFGANLYDTS